MQQLADFLQIPAVAGSSHWVSVARGHQTSSIVSHRFKGSKAKHPSQDTKPSLQSVPAKERTPTACCAKRKKNTPECFRPLKFIRTLSELVTCSYGTASPEKIAITFMSYPVFYTHIRSPLPKTSAMAMSLRLSPLDSRRYTLGRESVRTQLLIQNNVMKIKLYALFLLISL